MYKGITWNQRKIFAEQNKPDIQPELTKKSA